MSDTGRDFCEVRKFGFFTLDLWPPNKCIGDQEADKEDKSIAEPKEVTLLQMKGDGGIISTAKTPTKFC